MYDIGSSLYDRKVGADLEHARAVLDELRASALQHGAHAEIAVVNAARALAGYIEHRRPELRAAVGHASMAVTAEIEQARKKLKAWIAHLQLSLQDTGSLLN